MKQNMRMILWVLAVLILSGVAAAQRQPSQKHLKRAVCLEQCAADIAAQCVPRHGFHRCRGTLIRACQHRKPGVCVTTTTTPTTTTTATSTSPTTTSTTVTLCPAIPPGCNASFPIPRGCPCSLNCSNCVGSVCNTLTGLCE